jgi:formylglycine-generating enzyme required for sulfatase activity
MEFCYVPAGPFLMGSADEDEMAFDDEKPLHSVDVHYSYWLAQHPVTVVQFTTFVQTSGYILRDGKPLLGLVDCPVVYVTFQDAVAFCHWLSEKWQKLRLLPASWQVTLPSEAEWEKGARGGLEVPVISIIQPVQEIEDWQPGIKMQTNSNPKRVYPWGDEPDPQRANYDESGIDELSIIGQFPDGVSPYGCEEMSGNVWEWTRSHSKTYPYDPMDGRETLDVNSDINWTLRGGGFDDFARSVRCSVRVDLHTRGRLEDSGFRLVITPFSTFES